jgi:hypothetical protein
MKSKALTIGLVLAALIVSLMVGPLAGAQPTTVTQEQIEAAVVNGLTWLAAQQNPDGSWGTGCDRVAKTGLVVLKFETRAIEQRPPLDPMGDEYEYSTQVVNGLAYILANAHEQGISPQPAGDPDGNGNGKGVYFTDCGYHEIYNTGIAMMAIAASGHPEFYGGVLQDTLDYMAWAQADPGCGLHRGGWRYSGNQCDTDNSNAGYVTLGLGYAAAPPPYGFSLTIPQFVKDELSMWIDAIQDDVNGDTNDGGSWYTPYWSWVNILKTGNLLYEMNLVGDTVSTQRVQDAIDYIERHWYDGGGCGSGWRNHRQAMFTMMKGLDALGIDWLDLDGDGEPEHDWFDEVAAHLIDTQSGGGYWPWDCWGDQVLSTAWALLTLERAIPPIEVSLDIKPSSCPNPLNVKAKGVLPVAILGTDHFDVTQIDPGSVLLEGVAPLRWSLEDVATPFEPFIGKEDAYDCSEYGPDGYVDLTLKFKAQEIIAALGDVNDGDVLVLRLTGEEYGGRPIVGEDVIVILKKK